MIEFAIPITPDVIDSIFANRSSLRTDSEPDPNRLYASSSSSIQAAINETMEKVRNAVKVALADGYDAAKDVMDKVLEHVEVVKEELADRASDFTSGLLEELNRVVDGTYESVLGRMKTFVVIGGKTYTLRSVGVEHKLVVSGTVATSLTAMCKLVGSGEIVVKGTYELESMSPENV